MRPARLLKLANLGYPDGSLANYYLPDGSEDPDGNGDTLAQFIVRELQGVATDDTTNLEQLDEAVRLLENAKRDIDGVINVLAHAAENQRRRALKRHR